MRLLGIVTIAVLAAAAPGAALAADMIALPLAGDKSVPVDAGFDWNGFYAGVFGVSQQRAVGGVQYGLGLDIGVNARLDVVLVGGEVAIDDLSGGPATISGVGKLGVAVSDNVVAYAAAGVGTDLGGLGQTDALLGGGLEFALADNVSVDARYLHGFALSGANPSDQVTVGANFHF